MRYGYSSATDGGSILSFVSTTSADSWGDLERQGLPWSANP
jgi:hypothetical protein